MMRESVVGALAAAAMAVAPAALGQTAAASPPTGAAPAAAAYAISTLQRACLPILRGEQVKAAAQSAGFRLEDGGWVLPIAGKQEIDLEPPDAANPHVCTLSIVAPVGESAALRSVVGDWAAAQKPPLATVNAGVPGVGPAWVISTWLSRTPVGVESVVLTQPQPPTTAGSYAGAERPPATEQSTLLVSLSPT